MPYLNIDDDFTEHPKIDGLTDAAFRLHVAGMRHCAKNLTDGEVPRDRVRRMVPNFKPTTLKELLTAKVWHDGGDGCGTKTCPIGDPDKYVVHDYLEWNKSADWWKKKRAADAARQAEWRAKHPKKGDGHEEETE